MNAFALSSLLILIFSFCTGIFIYFKGRKDSASVVFSLFSFFICFWGLGGYKFSTTTSKEEALFWWQIAYLGIATPVIYAHFVFDFLKINRKRFLFIMYSIAIIFTLINFLFPHVFFGELKFVFSQFYWTHLDLHKNILVLIFYIIFYWIILLYFFYLLFKKYENSDGIEKIRVKYILVGSLFGWVGGHSDFLPTFGIYIYPYANFLVVIYISIFAYAILRHQLLDIEVIIKRTLIFAGLFTIVYGVFAFFALLGQVFFERFITQNRWVSMIPSVLVVTIMLRPLESFLAAATDKYLFQKKYDYKHLLKTFADDVLTVLELDRLIKLTEDKLTDILKLEYCKMIITKSKDIKIGAPLKIPISTDKEVVGMLLMGKKKSDEEYTKDDIDILQSLSKTLAIAISNAMLFSELGQAQLELARKDKMATIGTLAAGMAHEIRNPITTIRVFSEYVPDRLKDAEFTDKYRNTVTKEVDKIDHIIQTLIDFSGEDAISEMEDVSLSEAIDELLSLIGVDKGLKGEIRVVNEVPSNVPKIRVNRKELDEMLLNLIENAMHAIEGEGQITFRAVEKGEFVELYVIDTGCGMSQEVIKNIFHAFFTTRLKGFGLGLFVVKQLVNRNSGTISVESVVGEGTAFRLVFKRVDKI